jgi:hypothetical protein
MLLVVLATLGVIVAFTFATVKDGGEASAVDVVILKIALNSGIISASASSFPLAWPPVLINMFQVYAVISASAIGDSLSVDCVLRASNSLRPVQAWGLTMVVIPPCVIFLWVVLFATMTFLSTQKTNYLKVHLPVSVIVTLLFVHPVITKSAVKLVACRTVSGRDFLDADFNISCDSDEYVTWMSAIAIPMFVLFTFGVPMAYALAMYRHVRKGTLAARRDVYGFFFSGFRKGAWWFELWNTLRKSLFTISAVIFAPAGVMMQTWAALVLLLLFVVVFSLSQPYEEAYLNNLEGCALSINILTLLFGLGLFTNDQASEDAQNATFATIITICIVIFNLLFVVDVARTLGEHSQYCAVCSKSKRSSQVTQVETRLRRTSSWTGMNRQNLTQLVTHEQVVALQESHDEARTNMLDAIRQRQKRAGQRTKQRLALRKQNASMKKKVASSKLTRIHPETPASRATTSAASTENQNTRNQKLAKYGKNYLARCCTEILSPEQCQLLATSMLSSDGVTLDRNKVLHTFIKLKMKNPDKVVEALLEPTGKITKGMFLEWAEQQ